MAAVRLKAPTLYDPGIDYVGNDVYKALSIWAYYEATKTVRVSFPGRRREC